MTLLLDYGILKQKLDAQRSQLNPATDPFGMNGVTNGTSCAPSIFLNQILPKVQASNNIVVNGTSCVPNIALNQFLPKAQACDNNSPQLVISKVPLQSRPTVPLRKVLAFEDRFNDLVKASEKESKSKKASKIYNNPKKSKSFLSKSKRHTKGQLCFKARLHDLKVYKAKHGHCDVPRIQNNEHISLGRWCYDMRVAYKKFKRNERSRITLNEDKIQLLTELGFNWNYKGNNFTFNDRFKDLMAFKAKFGHCEVSTVRSSEYLSLGRWCCDVRGSYKKLKSGQDSGKHVKLNAEKIRRLTEAGFRWDTVRQS